MTTRLFQSKWVVVIGVLAVLGMMAAPALADRHHGGFHGGFRGGWGGSWHGGGFYGGYARPYYVAPYPYYYPAPVAPYPYYFYGYPGYGSCAPGWGFHVYVR
jgi:hypothetical protein